MAIRREISVGTMTSFDPGSAVPPSHSPDELIAFEQGLGANNCRPFPLVIARGRGSWVQDLKGNRYLDMLSSFSALNQGHRHPKIMAALKAQADRITLTSRAFHNDQLGPFLAKLTTVTGFQMALPMNTGAEAVDTALKAVRKWAHKHKSIPLAETEVIIAKGSSHARMTTTGWPAEQTASGFVSIPFGDLSALEKAIGDKTAAFLVEPIQVENGVILPPPEYFQGVRELCSQHDILLCMDEIQTGLGRTGRLFAFEHYGMRPDCVTVGKALGGGVFPVSAFLASRDIMAVFEPGEHRSTFAGNPLGSAVASASLDVVVDDGLVERSDELGSWFMEQLRDLNSPHVTEVRGSGLLMGVEIKVESGPACRFCEALVEKGILCNDTHPQVIRLAPPLTIDRDDLEWALVHLQEVLQ